MNYNGIDVSKYQGVIDWAKVKASGITFAFIRVGWAGYAGGIELDPRYHANMQGAIAAGVDVGIYLYSYCKTPEAAAVAAAQTLALVKPYRLTYPIAFDIEDQMYYTTGAAANNQLVHAFLGAIEAAGYFGILYTYTSFASSYLNMADLARYDLWIADYRGYVGYKGSYGIWQYTGQGRVDGITGDVDRNISYKDYPAIIAGAGLNQLAPKEEPEPEPEPPVEPKEPEGVVPGESGIRARLISLGRERDRGYNRLIISDITSARVSLRDGRLYLDY